MRYAYPKDHEIVSGVAKAGSRAAYARDVGIPPDTFTEYLSRRPLLRIAVNEALATKYVTEPSDEVTREEKLEAQVKELQAGRRRRRGEDVQFERVLDEIRAGISVAEPKYEPAHHDRSKLAKAHVHNLLFSDVHYGEVIRSEEVGGVNEYDTGVARRRIASVQAALESFVATRDYDIEELVISCLGDMVSSGPGIHDEIRETDEITSSEQAVEFGILLGEFVEELVPLYPRIRVLGVPGNHPRMAKPHASKRVFNNFDWVAYQVAQVHLRAYESVTCRFPKAGMLVEEIAGRNVYLFHGDGIRSSMPGVPWGGVVRRTNELRKLFAALDDPVILHAFQCGHFHDPNVCAGLLMNGGLTGTNEHGIKNFGGSSVPTQLLATWYPPKRKLTGVEFVTPK